MTRARGLPCEIQIGEWINRKSTYLVYLPEIHLAFAVFARKIGTKTTTYSTVLCLNLGLVLVLNYLECEKLSIGLASNQVCFFGLGIFLVRC
jgi:hypothetical protein